jgi:hypothetical protein
VSVTGTLSPGASTGWLDFSAGPATPLTLESGSTYACSVGVGALPTDAVSAPVITLDATSTLQFQIDGMFVAGTYDILESPAAIVGTFASSSGLGAYVTGTGLDYTTDPTKLKLTIDADLLGGDSNLDRIVNSDDASKLNENWLGTGKSWGDGDSDFNGVVNSDDASILNEKWLNTVDMPAVGTGSASYDPATGEILVSGNGIAQIGIESLSNALGDLGDVNWVFDFGTLKEDARPWRAVETAAGSNMPNFEDHLFFTAPAGIPQGEFDLQLRYQALYSGVTFTDVTYIPEPGTIVMLGIAALGLLVWRRRRAA